LGGARSNDLSNQHVISNYHVCPISMRGDLLYTVYTDFSPTFLSISPPPRLLTLGWFLQQEHRESILGWGQNTELRDLSSDSTTDTHNNPLLYLRICKCELAKIKTY